MIEEYFKALKSGMGVEDRQFDNADDLRKCPAFDAITACRVFQRMARNRPDAPAAEVADEIAVLYLDLAERGKSRAPPENLDVRTFVVDVGRLAGFIPSKRQPLPGTIKIWRGYGRLTFKSSGGAEAILGMTGWRIWRRLAIGCPSPEWITKDRLHGLDETASGLDAVASMKLSRRSSVSERPCRPRRFHARKARAKFGQPDAGGMNGTRPKLDRCAGKFNWKKPVQRGILLTIRKEGDQ